MIKWEDHKSVFRTSVLHFLGQIVRTGSTIYILNNLYSPPCMLQHPFLLSQLQLCVSGCVSVSVRFDVLSVSEVESREQGVVLRGWLASLILIKEDRWASHFHAQLLDSLLVVNGQQEGLEAGLWAHCGQDGEVLRKNTSCTAKEEGWKSPVYRLEWLWQRTLPTWLTSLYNLWYNV